jgi:hypothetical protein
MLARCGVEIRMARIRTIKPEFFRNEQLSELPIEDRLLFIGLWVIADRAGRLEDRPKRLKGELFPYDDLNVDAGLGRLVNAGLIVRYEGNGLRLIAIPTWTRHQIVNRDEAPSEYPGPAGEIDTLGRAPNDTVRYGIYVRDGFTCLYCGRKMQTDTRARCVDHVIPLSRGGSHHERNLVTACKKCNSLKGSKTPDEIGMPWPDGFGHTVNGGLTVTTLPGDRKGTDRELVLEVEGIRNRNGSNNDALAERFDRFWQVFPRKVGKDAALHVWMRLKPSEELTTEMVAAVEIQARTPQWRRDGGQYIPHPKTWLNQGRWKDSPDTAGSDDGLNGLRQAVIDA